MEDGRVTEAEVRPFVELGESHIDQPTGALSAHSSASAESLVGSSGTDRSVRKPSQQVPFKSRRSAKITAGVRGASSIHSDTTGRSANR